MGGGVGGRSAPFWRRSSATEKGLRMGWAVVGRPVGVDDVVGGRAPGTGELEGEAEADGDAGSAAARARKTAWVPRERSRALGLAFRASA